MTLTEAVIILNREIESAAITENFTLLANLTQAKKYIIDEQTKPRGRPRK